jgi:hypothetical protein
MDAALVTQQLVPPISLGTVMAMLPALGIEAQILQPKQLVHALQPGRLLQVGLQKGVCDVMQGYLASRPLHGGQAAGLV